jgi:hypothetical protein
MTCAPAKPERCVLCACAEAASLRLLTRVACAQLLAPMPAEALFTNAYLA